MDVFDEDAIPEGDIGEEEFEALFEGEDITSEEEEKEIVGEVEEDEAIVEEKERLESESEEEEPSKAKKKVSPKKPKKKLEKGKIVKISEGIVVSKKPYQFRKKGRRAAREELRTLKAPKLVTVDLKKKGGLVQVPTYGGENQAALRKRALAIVSGKFKIADLEAERLKKAGAAVFEDEGEEVTEFDIEFEEVQLPVRVEGRITGIPIGTAKTETVIVPTRRSKKGVKEAKSKLRKRAEEMRGMSTKEIQDLIDSLKYERKARRAKFLRKEKIPFIVVGRGNILVPLKSERETVDADRSLLARLAPENQFARFVPEFSEKYSTYLSKVRQRKVRPFFGAAEPERRYGVYVTEKDITSIEQLANLKVADVPQAQIAVRSRFMNIDLSTGKTVNPSKAQVIPQQDIRRRILRPRPLEELGRAIPAGAIVRYSGVSQEQYVKQAFKDFVRSKRRKAKEIQPGSIAAHLRFVECEAMDRKAYANLILGMLEDRYRGFSEYDELRGDIRNRVRPDAWDTVLADFLDENESKISEAVRDARTRLRAEARGEDVYAYEIAAEELRAAQAYIRKYLPRYISLSFPSPSERANAIYGGGVEDPQVLKDRTEYINSVRVREELEAARDADEILRRYEELEGTEREAKPKVTLEDVPKDEELEDLFSGSDDETSDEIVKDIEEALDAQRALPPSAVGAEGAETVAEKLRTEVQKTQIEELVQHFSNEFSLKSVDEFMREIRDQAEKYGEIVSPEYVVLQNAERYARTLPLIRIETVGDEIRIRNVPGTSSQNLIRDTLKIEGEGGDILIKDADVTDRLDEITDKIDSLIDSKRLDAGYEVIIEGTKIDERAIKTYDLPRPTEDPETNLRLFVRNIASFYVFDGRYDLYLRSLAEFRRMNETYAIVTPRTQVMIISGLELPPDVSKRYIEEEGYVPYSFPLKSGEISEYRIKGVYEQILENPDRAYVDLYVARSLSTDEIPDVGYATLERSTIRRVKTLIAEFIQNEITPEGLQKNARVIFPMRYLGSEGSREEKRAFIEAECESLSKALRESEIDAYIEANLNELWTQGGDLYEEFLDTKLDALNVEYGEAMDEREVLLTENATIFSDAPREEVAAKSVEPTYMRDLAQVLTENFLDKPIHEYLARAARLLVFLDPANRIGKYAEILRGKIKNGLYNVRGLVSSTIVDLMPEFALNAGLSTKERREAMIQIVEITHEIEKQLANETLMMINPTRKQLNLQSRSYVFRSFAKYVDDPRKSCVEGTDATVPAEDLVMCYEEGSKKFYCIDVKKLLAQVLEGKDVITNPYTNKPLPDETVKTLKRIALGEGETR